MNGRALSNALLITSNGTQSRVGTITADWERFLRRMREMLLPYVWFRARLGRHDPRGFDFSEMLVSANAEKPVSGETTWRGTVLA